MFLLLHLRQLAAEAGAELQAEVEAEADWILTDMTVRLSVCPSVCSCVCAVIYCNIAAWHKCCTAYNLCNMPHGSATTVVAVSLSLLRIELNCLFAFWLQPIVPRQTVNGALRTGSECRWNLCAACACCCMLISWGKPLKSLCSSSGNSCWWIIRKLNEILMLYDIMAAMEERQREGERGRDRERTNTWTSAREQRTSGALWRARNAQV